MLYITNIKSEQLAHYLQHPEAQVLKKYRKQPKVLEMPDQQIVKIFYPRRKWYYFLTRPRPHALSFVQNAQRLIKLGISAPVISKLLYCQEKDIYVITYPKMSGGHSASIMQNEDGKLIGHLGVFIAKLHEKGIFFRSLHLENILYQPAKRAFTLIDVSDVRFKPRRLSARLRYRNVKHFMTYRKSIKHWTPEKIKIFMDQYLRQAHMTHSSEKYFSKRIAHLMNG